jgi:hypothetical protein
MPFSLSPFRRAAKAPARLVSDAGQAFEALEDRCMMAAAAFVSYTVQDSSLTAIVRYTDSAGVTVATLGDNDVALTGPNNFNRAGHLTQVVQDTPGSNNSVRATYTFASRTGAWNFTDIGTYVLNMLPSTVSGGGGNVPSGQLGSLWLWFSTPKAELISAVASPTQYLVTIKYSDNVGISQTSIGFGEIGLQPVDRPSDTQFFRSQTYVQNADHSWTVQYRLTARGGSWDWTDTGTYNVVLRGNAVHDTETPTHFIPAQSLGQFFLWFSNPKAQIVSQSITANNWLVTIRWTDNNGLDSSSFNDGDIQVNNGIATVLGTRVSAAPTEGATSANVTYSLRPTGFPWGAAENGTYVISTREGQTEDTTSVGVHSVSLGSFWLWFDTPSISKPVNVNGALPNRWDITVRYTDNASMNFNTIGNGDLRIEGPGGFVQQATLLAKHNEVVNGVTTVVATYRFTPTGSQFANGTYNIFVNPNQVSDNTGHFIPQALWGSFFLFF